VELEQARAFAVTQKLDLAMSTLTANLGNPYVVEDMKALGQMALQEHQMLMAKSAQSDEFAMKREEMAWRTTERQEGHLDAVAEIQAQRDAQMDRDAALHGMEMEQIRARGEEQRKTQAESPGAHWQQIFQAGQLVDQELSRKPEKQWIDEAKSAGFGKDVPGYQRRARAEMMADALAGSGIPRQMWEWIEPPWMMQPDADANKSPYELKADQIQDVIDRLREEGTPENLERADRLEQRKQEYIRAIPSEVGEEADEILEESWLGLFENIVRDAGRYGETVSSGDPWSMSKRYSE
jgi:hypothetical protein